MTFLFEPRPLPNRPIIYWAFHPTFPSSWSLRVSAAAEASSRELFFYFCRCFPPLLWISRGKCDVVVYGSHVTRHEGKRVIFRLKFFPSLFRSSWHLRLVFINFVETFKKEKLCRDRNLSFSFGLVCNLLFLVFYIFNSWVFPSYVTKWPPALSLCLAIWCMRTPSKYFGDLHSHRLSLCINDGNVRNMEAVSKSDGYAISVGIFTSEMFPARNCFVMWPNRLCRHFPGGII